MVSNLVPDYEVKLLLKPSEVLESNNKLKDVVSSAFSITSKSKKMNIQFVDTKTQDIYIKGWNLRIRKTEEDIEFELTYKKRYSIGDGFSSTAEGNIDAALETAEQDGFNSTSTFEAQVEMGYQKQTLSISHDEKVPDTDFTGMDLPLADTSRQFLADRVPTKFKNWSADNWGTDHLAQSIVYGPVLAKRFKGTMGKGTPDEHKLFIEVWPIRKSKTDASLEPIVEASFKTPDLTEALKGRDKLIGLLQDNGWLLTEDSLKTKLIMERYGESIAHL